ncbi:MAG: leucine-rich repeat domain-containing protein [Clostridia bacterium]|nr:leucine-rich repeat domain-containing protein [Clostridia bacterium]
MRQKVALAVFMSLFLLLCTGAIVYFAFVYLSDSPLDSDSVISNENSEINAEDIKRLSVAVGANGRIHINGIDTGVIANSEGGKDGLTPYINANGNWCIGNTDTGISAVGKNGADGKDGKNGADGKDGENGKDGADGEDGLTPYINTDGNWWIGTTNTGICAAGKNGTDGKDGINGINGKDGKDGKDGENGLTPYINTDGNWWIGTTNTGVCAAGKNGTDGKDGINGINGKGGEDGKDGENGLTPYINTDGNWWIGTTNTGISAKGENGADGVGISGVKVLEGSLYISYTNAPGKWIELGKIESETYGLEYYPLPDGTFGVSAGKLLYVESITIPREYGGKEVTEILPGGFSGAVNLKNITIPSTVTKIGSSAFMHAESLESIILPESVKTVGKNAFLGCGKLTIRLCSSYIPEDFSEGFNPDNLEVILGYSEESGSTESGIKYEKTEGGVAITGYFGESYFVEIPEKIDGESVVSISAEAFRNNMNILSISLPQSLEKIEDGAFDGCLKLVEIYNFSSLSISAGGDGNGKIGKCAKAVRNDGVTESILSEDENGFVFMNTSGAYYLIAYVGNGTDVALPENYEGGSYSVYDYAFSGNGNITSLTVSEGVKSIGKYAFSGLMSLTVLNFNAVSCGALSSDSNAFYTIGESTVGVTVRFGKNVTAVPAYLFNSSATESGKPKIISVSFEEGSKCSEIGAYAFANLDSLECLSIPNSLKCIEKFAFYGCNSLREVATSGIWYADAQVLDFAASLELTATYLTKTYASSKLERKA